MLKVDEKYTIINYIFSGTVFWALVMPILKDAETHFNLGIKAISIFENGFLDGLFAVVLFLLTGMVFSHIKGYFFKEQYPIIEKKMRKKSGIKELEALKWRYKNPFLFANQSYLLMLRSGYNIMFLINMLLFVNSLGTMIMALTLVSIIYIISAWLLLAENYALASFIIVVFIYILIAIKERFKNMFQKSLFGALHYYFTYGFHKK